MHPGRALGATLGFATFLAAYFLPFAGGTNETLLDPTTTNSIFGSTVSMLENVSSKGLGSSSIILVAGVVMIVAGGTLGVRPRAGAPLGVTGMVAATLWEYMSAPGKGISLTSYGSGYWVLWATAIGTLAAMLWVWRDERPPPKKESAKGWAL